MITVGQICDAINLFAPFASAESYDNVGLLLGDAQAEVKRAVIALDCTDEVIDEAVNLGANLIITHHPVIFNPIKNIPSSSIVYKAIKNNLSVISAHTNLDMAHGGVNDVLAEKLGLEDIIDFDITHKINYNKLSVFVPEENAEDLREKLCEAGAGNIGNYSDCTFSTEGSGRFMPKENANPYIGKKGKVERVDETKIEVVYHPKLEKEILSALKKYHPYETPAYDIFEDKGLSDVLSIGRVGNLKNPMTAKELARFTKETLGCKGIEFVDTNDKRISRVAVCGGAGGSLLDLALNMGAQAYITSEIKHNVWLDAKRNNIALIDAGHYYTERVVLEELCSVLWDEFEEVAFSISRREKGATEFI